MAIGAAILVAAPAFSADKGAKTEDSKVQGPSVGKVSWSRLDHAMSVASQAGKPILVSVYADWCGYCKLMERTTWANSGIVGQISEGWVPVRLNGESSEPLKLGGATISERQWAVGNGVQGFPATFLLDSKGKPFAGVPGYIEAPQMARLLQDAQAYLKAGGPAVVGDFYDWAEKRN